MADILGIGIRKCFIHIQKDLDMQGKSTNLKIVCIAKHTVKLCFDENMLSFLLLLLLPFFHESHHHQLASPYIHMQKAHIASNEFPSGARWSKKGCRYCCPFLSVEWYRRCIWYLKRIVESLICVQQFHLKQFRRNSQPLERSDKRIVSNILLAKVKVFGFSNSTK